MDDSRKIMNLETVRDQLTSHNIDSEPLNAWLCNIHSGCCRISCIEDLPGTISIETLDYMIQEFQDEYAGEWGSEEEYTRDAVKRGALPPQTDAQDLFTSEMYALGAPGGRIFTFHVN